MPKSLPLSAVQKRSSRLSPAVIQRQSQPAPTVAIRTPVIDWCYHPLPRDLTHSTRLGAAQNTLRSPTGRARTRNRRPPVMTPDSTIRRRVSFRWSSTFDRKCRPLDMDNLWGVFRSNSPLIGYHSQVQKGSPMQFHWACSSRSLVRFR